MADWDPFADPADDEQAVTSGPGAASACSTAPAPSCPEKEPQDVYAALEALKETDKKPGKEPKKWTEEEFSLLLDKLFSTDDSDTKALEDALKPVWAALADDGMLNFCLWRRALPMMFALSKKQGPMQPNLFGLLIDGHCGLYAKDRREMSEFAVDIPPDAKGNGAVVFLFAWGGGSVGDMDDMAALYREISPGSVIVRTSCNMKASFGLRCQCASAIKTALMAWAQTPEGMKKRLFVHLFSNGGFMTWTELLQCWATLSSRDEAHPDLDGPVPPLADVLCGVILDSACDSNISIGPCLQSLVQSMAGFMYQVASSDHDGSKEGEKAADLMGRKAISVLISSDSPVKEHLMKKPEKFLTRQSCVDAHIVHRLEPPVNMQFIYSKDDNVIRYEPVEDYIEQVMKRESRKGWPHPRRLVFEKSRHCFHKVVHKEEYCKCVRLFAGNSLAA